MHELMSFHKEEFGDVRAVNSNGKPLFVAKDVAEKLGYTNPQKAVRDHCKNTTTARRVNDSFTLENPMGYALDPQTVLIDQSDVLRLIVRSSLPAAERIERWIFDEVIPAVLETGGYMLTKADDTPETIMARAVLVAQETIERLKNRTAELEDDVQRMKPKELFADSVSASESSILVGQLAALLKQNGVNIGQNRLFERLRNDGFLIKFGERRNCPTQRALEMGLFELKERTVNNPDGSVRITLTTKVTGKGQVYFVNRYIGENRKASVLIAC